MIDEALTERKLGVTPYQGADARVTNRYRTQDFVVTRCDVCGRVYGEQHGTKLCSVLQKRKRDDGKDLCLECLRDQRNPLRVFNNAKTEFLKIVEANKGSVPRREDLPWALVAAINTHHGGIRAFRARCGLPTIRRASGWWTQWNNLEAELRPLCEELGFFPPDQYLLAIRANSLRSALRYFGGARKVAERLGVKMGTGYEADDGHFVLSYYEFAVDNLLFYHGVPHEVHPRIRKGDNRRGDFKVGGTYVEVAGYAADGRRARTRRYHQKLDEKLEFYSASGRPVIVIFKEDFDDIDAVVTKLRPLIDDHGQRVAEVDIVNAIRPVSWWSEWENVRCLLQEAMDAVGHFPTAAELERMGNSCVAHYIMKFHGGLPNARKQMGARVRQESPGYFEEWDNVARMFQPICEQLGYFPTAADIRERKYGLIDCSSSLYKY